MTTPRPITEGQYRLLKPLARWMSRLHLALYRGSGGRIGAAFGGGDVCMVHMIGAKSGRALSLPLMYVPEGDAVLLVASFAGGPHHPSWYYNLTAHPRIEIECRGKRGPYLATCLSTTEKAAVWPLCCQHYRDFDLYQRRTTRDIPVFRCTPCE